jgi:hypothetical protein
MRPGAACVTTIVLIAAVTAAPVTTFCSIFRRVAQGEHGKHHQGRYQERPFHYLPLFPGEGKDFIESGRKKM